MVMHVTASVVAAGGAGVVVVAGAIEGAGASEIVSAAGVTGVLLAAGWKLISWADARSARERSESEASHTETRAELAAERVAHAATHARLDVLADEVSSLRVEVAVLTTRLAQYEEDT